jgi:nitrogen fixation protein NifU and related proteins
MGHRRRPAQTQARGSIPQPLAARREEPARPMSRPWLSFSSRACQVSAVVPSRSKIAVTSCEIIAPFSGVRFAPGPWRGRHVPCTFMALFPGLGDDRVSATKYQIYGCAPTIASGYMLTEMIVGRTISECWQLTVEDLIEALDGVPPEKLHCPALAIGAPKDALAKWPTDQRAENSSESRSTRPQISPIHTDGRTGQDLGVRNGKHDAGCTANYAKSAQKCSAEDSLLDRARRPLARGHSQALGRSGSQENQCDIVECLARVSVVWPIRLRFFPLALLAFFAVKRDLK